MAPWYPNVSLDGNWDRFTKFEMALQAVSIAPKSAVNSFKSGFKAPTSFIKRVNVTPVVEHTSAKTGDLVRARFILGGASEAVVDMERGPIVLLLLTAAKAGLPLFGAKTKA